MSVDSLEEVMFLSYTH